MLDAASETTNEADGAAAPEGDAPAGNLTDAAKVDTPAEGSAEGDAQGTEATEAKDEAPKREVPESADQYDFTVPADLGLKDEKGDPFSFAADDPLVAEAREIFFEGGVPKETAAKIVGLYAKAVKDASEATSAAQAEQIDAHVKAELAKLDRTVDGKTTPGAERVGKILNALDAALGEGASKRWAPRLMDAAQVVDLEKLIARGHEPSAQKPSGGSDGLEGLHGEALLRAIRAKQA